MVLHWPLTCFLISLPFLSVAFRPCRRRSRVVRPIGLDSLGTNYRHVPLIEQLLCSYCDRSSCVGCSVMLVFCAQLVFCWGKHSFLSRCFWCYFFAPRCEMFKSLKELRVSGRTRNKQLESLFSEQQDVSCHAFFGTETGRNRAKLWILGSQKFDCTERNMQGKCN